MINQRHTNNFLTTKHSRRLELYTFKTPILNTELHGILDRDWHQCMQKLASFKFIKMLDICVG